MESDSIKQLFESIKNKAQTKFNIFPKINLHFRENGSVFLGLAGINSINFYINTNYIGYDLNDYYKFLVFHEYAHIYHKHWIKKFCFWSFLGIIYGLTVYKNLAFNPEMVIGLSSVCIPLIIYDPLNSYFENQADNTAIEFLNRKDKYNTIKKNIRGHK